MIFKLQNTIGVNLLLCVSMLTASLTIHKHTVAQEPQPQTPSTAIMGTKTDASTVSYQSPGHQLQLMQLLQSIDPYLPAGDIEGKAVLSGSTTMVLLGQTWAQRFKLFHPKVEFARGVDGTDASLEALAQDPNVIAGVSRNVTDAELAKLKAGQCKDPMVVLVALDPMAIYVNEKNPVKSLSPEQIQGVLGLGPNGESVISTWGQLGVTGELANQKIRIHHRSEVSGTRNFIQQSLLGGKPLAEPAETHKSNHEICQAVAKDPAAIALCGFGDRVDGTRTVALEIHGQVVEANDANFLAGKYPMVRPLSLVLDRAQLGQDRGLRQSILKYILSRDGQREAILAGFFPLNPDFIRQELVQLTGTQSH
jgi:phosphate transport system substrate-binding protein